MKYLKLATVLFLISILLLGCNSRDYRFVEDETGSYIIYSGKELPSVEDVGFIEERTAPIVYFSSLQEMRTDIRLGRFTEEEFEELDYANVLGGSRDSLKTPDLNSILLLQCPDECNNCTIAWHVDSEVYHWEFDLGQDASGKLEVVNFGRDDAKAAERFEYLKHIWDEESQRKSKQYREITVSQETERNAQVIRCIWDSSRFLADIYKIYSFEANQTEYFVLEKYQTRSEQEAKSSLQYVRILFQSGDLYIDVALKDLPERPSIAFLTQFGVTRGK